jgi:hypothetical protein
MFLRSWIGLIRFIGYFLGVLNHNGFQNRFLKRKKNLVFPATLVAGFWD